jgi:hypothetical protein
MKNETEIARVSTEDQVWHASAQPLHPQTEASNLLQIIANAVIDPRVDIDKMERLLAMQERLVADQRKSAYMAAMARVAAVLPFVPKTSNGHYGMYSGLNDIDRVLRPIISPEGLSLSFDSAPVDGKPGYVRVYCTNSHADGHSETKQIDLEIDKSGSKNGAQAVISTVSYGRRSLTKMFYNIIEGNEDSDGNNSAVITEDQVKDLQIMIQDVGINTPRFLLHMKVGELKDILAKDYKAALNAVEAKRIENAKKAGK